MASKIAKVHVYEHEDGQADDVVVDDDDDDETDHLTKPIARQVELVAMTTTAKSKARQDDHAQRRQEEERGGGGGVVHQRNVLGGSRTGGSNTEALQRCICACVFSALVELAIAAAPALLSADHRRSLYALASAVVWDLLYFLWKLYVAWILYRNRARCAIDTLRTFASPIGTRYYRSMARLWRISSWWVVFHSFATLVAVYSQIQHISYYVFTIIVTGSFVVRHYSAHYNGIIPRSRPLVEANDKDDKDDDDDRSSIASSSSAIRLVRLMTRNMALCAGALVLRGCTVLVKAWKDPTRLATILRVFTTSSIAQQTRSSTILRTASRILEGLDVITPMIIAVLLWKFRTAFVRIQQTFVRNGITTIATTVPTTALKDDIESPREQKDQQQQQHYCRRDEEEMVFLMHAQNEFYNRVAKVFVSEACAKIVLTSVVLIRKFLGIW